MEDSLALLSQATYHAGQELKTQHESQHAVLGEGALLSLATDFAQLALCRDLRDPFIHDAHSRAALRIVAFQRGYRGEPAGL